MTLALPDAFRRIPLAHRALHDKDNGRPENSRAAVLAAISNGYGIEIDVQPSKEGCAMVFHDYDLKRLTGQHGAIQQRRAEGLGQIALLGGDEGIPTLSEVLELVRGTVPLLIELKDQHGQMGVTDGRLEQAVAQDLRGYAGPVAVMSFNPHMVLRMAALAPDIPRGIVTCGYTPEDWPLLRAETRERLRVVADYGPSESVFVSHDVSDLGNPRLSKLHADGAVILCWTVRSVEEEARARTVADNITFEGYLPDIPA